MYYNSNIKTSQPLPYARRGPFFWKHLLTCEATVRKINDVWAFGPPMVVHGFLEKNQCTSMIERAPCGSYFFRLSNSEPDMLIAIHRSIKGVKQEKLPAFVDLDAFFAFLNSKKNFEVTHHHRHHLQ